MRRSALAMNRTWAKREKQMEKIISNTAKFTGELQALYGPYSHVVSFITTVSKRSRQLIFISSSFPAPCHIAIA
jgi:alkylhydroperoxidase/carboxymuconolactone decarboxylase family protein YurZ